MQNKRHIKMGGRGKLHFDYHNQINSINNAYIDTVTKFNSMESNKIPNYSVINTQLQTLIKSPNETNNLFRILENLFVNTFESKLLIFQKNIDPSFVSIHCIDADKIKREWQDMIDNHPHLPLEQIKTVDKIIEELSKKEFSNPIIIYLDISADDEVLIKRQDNKGIFYIIIGDNEQDVTYGRVGKTPGDFDSIHINSHTLNYIIQLFLESIYE